MRPRIFHFSFPLVVRVGIPENKDFFLFGIAKIRDGPRAQIDFDTFFKVKKLPKLARRGDGVICTLPKRKICFFLDSFPRIVETTWRLGKFSHIKLACLKSIARFATSSSPTLGC